MKFLSLSRLFGAGRRARPIRNGLPAGRGRDQRPALELLEDRLAPAGNLFWTGGADIATGGANNLWSTPQNWVDQNGVQRPPAAGDTLIFGTYTPPNPGQIAGGAPNTGTVFNDFTNLPQLTAIYFNTPNWDLRGNPVSLSGDASGLGLVLNNSTLGDSIPATPDVNVELAISMAADQTFQIRNGQARLAISLLVRINSHTLTLDPEGGSVMDISGRLDDPNSIGFDAQAGGIGFVPNSKVVKNGTGQTISSGTDNRYGGSTTINNGILWAESDTALGPSLFGSTNGIPGNTSIGTFVNPGGSLGIGTQVASGGTFGLFITEDIFLAGDGFQRNGALINVGSNPALGQPPVTNSLFGTVTLDSPSGETLISMLPGGTLDHTGGWKQPQAAQGLNAPHVQALTIFGNAQGAGGTLIMDGRGPDPFWGSATTPFENLFFTNTYTGLTWVREGTLDLEKEVREADSGGVFHLINSNPTSTASGPLLGGNYSSPGVNNLPTDPLLRNSAGGPPGGYAIMGDLTIGDTAGAPNSAAVRTIISEPSRDDPVSNPPVEPIEEIEDEQIKDSSTVTVNGDGLFDVRSYGDPFRKQLRATAPFGIRPVGERIASLNVIGGNVLLEVNPNPQQFPFPPVFAGANVSPPAFIVGTLMTGNLVLQGGAITGQTAQGGQLEGTLMLVGGGITTLASANPSVINCLLDMGYQTRTVVDIHGTAPIDLDIQGPVGDGGLVITASTSGGVVRMSADNNNIVPNNYTNPLTFPSDTMPDLGPFQQFFGPPPYPALGDDLFGEDVAITLVSGTLLLANNNAVGEGRLIIGGGSIASDDPSRVIANPVTINGDFSFTGANITFSGEVAIQGTHTVTVGPLAATFSGQVVNTQGFSGGLFKAGTGILVYSGDQPNTYSGTTWVRDGALLLTKKAGVIAVPGALYVGDDQGPPNSAIVGLYANGQIPPNASIVVSSDGNLSLVGGVSQTLATLQSSGAVVLGVGAGGPALLVVTGPVLLSGGSIAPGTAGGSLQLASNVRVVPGVGPTMIFADVTLIGPAIHTFSTDPGAVLAIVGAIDGDSSVYKTGSGVLVYGGTTANTYTGITWVQDGGLVLAKAASVTAVPTALYVGDGQGDVASAIVAVQTDQQLPTTSDVAVNGDGLFEIASNVTDFINTLNLAGILQLDPGSHLFVHQVVFGPGAVIVDNSPGGLGAY